MTITINVKPRNPMPIKYEQSEIDEKTKVTVHDQLAKGIKEFKRLDDEDAKYFEKTKNKDK